MARVAITTISQALCVDCGWTFELPDAAEAAHKARRHEGDHERWRQIGELLAGFVFDAPAGSTAAAAGNAAVAAGFRFVTFNGWVYRTDDVKGKRICQTTDVPAVTA